MGCKNLNDQTRSGKHKTTDFKAMLKDILANPGSSTLRVSGELRISQFSVIHYLDNLCKSIENYQILLYIKFLV